MFNEYLYYPESFLRFNKQKVFFLTTVERVLWQLFSIRVIRAIRGKRIFPLRPSAARKAAGQSLVWIFIIIGQALPASPASNLFFARGFFRFFLSDFFLPLRFNQASDFRLPTSAKA